MVHELKALLRPVKTFRADYQAFKLDSWAGFGQEQLLLVRFFFLLLFVVSCFSVTKSLRSANSSLFVFVFVSSRWLINISFQGLTPSAQIPRERFPIILFISLNLVMDKPLVDNVNVKLISLNARGIRDFAKRKAIFSWIQKQNADIAFLQETYSTPDIVEKWRFQWRRKMFCSHGTNHSRGVLILISDKLQFELKHVRSDTDGRYVLIDSFFYC